MNKKQLLDFLVFGADLDEPERTYLGFELASLPAVSAQRQMEGRIDAHLINSLMEEAVRRQLDSFGPRAPRVALLLSGGIDSANLLAILRRCGVQDIRAYTWEKSHVAPSADAERARLTAQHFDVDHHTFLAQGDLLNIEVEILDRETVAMGRPLNFFESVMMASLRDRAMEDGCSLVFYGQNADTLWMSYPAPVLVHRLFQVLRWTPISFLVSPMVAMSYFKSNATLAYLNIPLGYWARLNALYRTIESFGLDMQQSIILMEEMFTESRIRQTNECFVLGRKGMVVGNPYYDSAVVNAALLVPPKERSRDGFGKTMLHEVARLNGVPEEIILKGKKGLSYGHSRFLRERRHLPLWDDMMGNRSLRSVVRLDALRRRREDDAYVLERLFGLHRYLVTCHQEEKKNDV